MPLPNNDVPPNPYDELPYLAYPIEWTAPEHLALASLLHGGPRLPLDSYRVLELGCANGANLLPMAWYRQHAEFTGLDASARQIEFANESKDHLGLTNLRFVHADFRSALDHLDGQYDIIMAHGVFSWVTDEVRDAMLELCSSMLAPGGLLYLNYNTRPGWTIRGMVRDFLMTQTVHVSSLKERAEMCRDISASVISPLQNGEHAYTQLMANEFQLVVNNYPAYIAHEYLSPENNAYWRSEFFEVLGSFGFDYVADADFNCISNRITAQFAELLTGGDLDADAAGDSADLMCYRQMQSPILTQSPHIAKACSDSEFSDLYMSSNLIPVDTEEGDNPTFRQPSGQEIETSDDAIAGVLAELEPLWPHGRRLKTLFSDVAEVRESLEYMLKNELVQLRCIEPGDFDTAAEKLNKLELSLHGLSTSAWHTTVEAAESA